MSAVSFGAYVGRQFWGLSCDASPLLLHRKVVLLTGWATQSLKEFKKEQCLRWMLPLDGLDDH
jgi:hypothetical protein